MPTILDLSFRKKDDLFYLGYINDFNGTRVYRIYDLDEMTLKILDLIEESDVIIYSEETFKKIEENIFKNLILLALENKKFINISDYERGIRYKEKLLKGRLELECRAISEDARYLKDFFCKRVKQPTVKRCLTCNYLFVNNKIKK